MLATVIVGVLLGAALPASRCTAQEAAARHYLVGISGMV